MSSTGGTIEVSIIKPTVITSDYVQCSSVSSSVLFYMQLEITSEFVPVPTVEPVSLQQSNNFKGLKSAPFYAISLTVVMFLLYAVTIVRMRDANDNIASLTLVKVCLHLGLFGANIASEIAYINAVLTNDDRSIRAFGVVVLLARLSHLPGGCYILVKLMANQDHSNHYLQLADKDDLLKNRTAYSLLFLTSFLDNTNIAYLPWLCTKVKML